MFSCQVNQRNGKRRCIAALQGPHIPHIPNRPYKLTVRLRTSSFSVPRVRNGEDDWRDDRFQKDEDKEPMQS
jgi:hypothetical protein